MEGSGNIISLCNQHRPPCRQGALTRRETLVAGVNGNVCFFSFRRGYFSGGMFREQEVSKTKVSEGDWIGTELLCDRHETTLLSSMMCLQLDLERYDWMWHDGTARPFPILWTPEQNGKTAGWVSHVHKDGKISCAFGAHHNECQRLRRVSNCTWLCMYPTRFAL